jgi:hypothetical protein
MTKNLIKYWSADILNIDDMNYPEANFFTIICLRDYEPLEFT